MESKMYYSLLMRRQLSQMNPAHPLIPYFLNFHFNGTCRPHIYVSILQVATSLQIFQLKLCVFAISSIRATRLVHLIILDLISPIVIGEQLVYWKGVYTKSCVYSYKRNVNHK
jgi:hypothetical protein